MKVDRGPTGATMRGSATAPSDRGVARRRLAVAALASAILHVCLYGGLSATHIGLLDGRPRDPDASRPSLVPKMAADYPLTVPRSPAATPDHERPLDMSPPPAVAPEPAPRPPEKMVDRRIVPEPAAEPPIPKPELARTERRPEETAAQEPQPLDRRDAAAPAAAAAVDRVMVEAGRETQSPLPQPAAAEPRSRAASAAAGDRRDAAGPENTLEIAGPGPMDSPRLVAVVPAPAATATVRPVERRAAAAAAMAADETRAAPAAARAAATPEPEPPRPEPGRAGIASRAGGTRSAVRPRPSNGASTAGDVAEGSAGESAVARLRPFGQLAAGQPSAAGAGGPAAPAAMPGVTALARAAPSAGGPSGDDGSAVAVAAPAATTVSNSAASSATAVASGGGSLAPAIGSRLAMRSSGRPGGPGVGRAAPAASVGPGGSGDDAEEPLSIGDPGSRPLATAARRDDGRDSGRGQASGLPSAAGRGDATQQTAPIATQPLVRSSSFVLPTAGRDREVALPFARRSRANRDAEGKGAAESDVVVRPKTRVVADAMIDRGLDFLARAQAADGRWRLESYPGAQADAPRLVSDTAATGLAILSFLGAGHDHFGGRHRDTVRRGLEFLISVQKPDGDLYVPADQLSNSCAWLYSHGIASMALCEAVGMTGDPLVKPAAAQACRFIAASQHSTRGGWRYTPGSDADLSVSGWMLVALRSGRLAGVDVDPRSLAGVRALLDQSGSPTDPAKYFYNPASPQQRPSRLSSACMTAVGTLGRLHTGWSPSDPRVRQAAGRLLEIRPVYGTPTQRTRDCYLWYYASQVLVHTGGDPWADWFDVLADQLERSQEPSGPTAGSWNPLGPVPDRWGSYGGRIYVTCLHLLTLEVPERRLPTYGSPEDVAERADAARP